MCLHFSCLTSVDSTSCVQMRVKQGKDVLDNVAGVLSDTHRCTNVTHLLHTKENKPDWFSGSFAVCKRAVCCSGKRERMVPTAEGSLHPYLNCLFARL